MFVFQGEIKNKYIMLIKLSLLALFGIAMAHLEGVVVVYLRKALGMLDSDSNKESVEKFPKPSGEERDAR